MNAIRRHASAEEASVSLRAHVEGPTSSAASGPGLGQQPSSGTRQTHSRRRPFLSRLLSAGEAIDAGDLERARALVEGILRAEPDTGDASERISGVFGRALLARLDGDRSGDGNLYLRSAGPRDMLAAFQLLVHATPLIRFGYLSANAAIVEAFQHEEEIHVIDIGVGGGTQWPFLLHRLATRPGGPPRVRLTGIDLPCRGPDPEQRLRWAGAFIGGWAERLKVPFEFHGVASSVERVDWSRIASRSTAPIAVNAAFALHHVPDASVHATANRDTILTRIRALSPRVLTLVEPDVEHNALPFLPRLSEAIGHYYAVFQALEALLPPHIAARETIEQVFFGQEVMNVVVGEGAARVERHERRGAWQRRLRMNGFEPLRVSPHESMVRGGLRLNTGFDVRADEPALLLMRNGVSIVAASAWRPRQVPPPSRFISGLFRRTG
ncbi:GRAS family protein [Sorangium sp. So ce296]|uniref:GRAS-like transcription factor n=1 Tax=Sorangium cellulosum TaxID=56 RepID=A0A150T7R2_SORCE|nr:GRAS-like transcription factor [Sorangium cellulosum]KYG00679.1 GRAS-like transcription factor [Sorangium cellulosum]